MERLCEIFRGIHPNDSKELNMKVFEAVNTFAGDTPQSDDITCLTLHRSEA